MEYLPESEWRESDLESRAVEIVEAMISPRSRLIGKTLREAHFRDRYGLSVLAIWRGDEEMFTYLADIELAFGDAMLLQGSRDKIALAIDDPDLILLVSRDEAEITVPGKGRAALLIFVATILLAIAIPDLTAAIVLGGALGMMLTGIISTEQAYSSIGWKSVFLVAGMLPMGIALTKTNAASLAAVKILEVFGGHGSLVLISGMFIVAVVLTQLINGAVAATIIGPIAIQIAHQAGVDPRAMVMGVAMATSMAFITPLSHAVNVLVMSPGGYSFKDYLKVGLPLSLLLFVVAIACLDMFWL
jgi:di/tricarboxylate transporter